MLSPVEELQQEIFRFQKEVTPSSYKAHKKPSSPFYFGKFLSLTIIYDFCKNKPSVPIENFKLYYQFWLALNAPFTLFEEEKNNFKEDELVKNLLRSKTGKNFSRDDTHIFPTRALLNLIKDAERGKDDDIIKNLLEIYPTKWGGFLLNSWLQFSSIIEKMSQLNAEELNLFKETINLYIQTPLDYDDTLTCILNGAFDYWVTREEVARHALEIHGLFSSASSSMTAPDSLPNLFGKK